MNEFQTTLEALRIFRAGRCVPALVWESMQGPGVRIERRHVGQLFEHR